MSSFFRLIGTEDKDAALRQMIAALNQGVTDERLYSPDPASFLAVPGAPFSYWVSNEVRLKFKQFSPLETDDEARVARRTNSVDQDFRFVRASWECPSTSLNWIPWAKGGRFAPFYYDIETLISWSHDRGTYPGFIGTASRPLERPASMNLFFRPGLTWPRRTNGLSIRVLPSQSIFGDKGPSAFINGDAPGALLSLCAIMNSRVFGYLVSVQLARTELAQSFEVGLIQQTPVPDLTPEQESRLAALARRAWSIKRGLDTIIETSHAFTLPALLADFAVAGGPAAGADPAPASNTLAERAAAWARHRAVCEASLAAIQAEIDGMAFTLYGITGDDRSAVEAFDAKTPQAAGATSEDEAEDDDGEEDDQPTTASSSELAAQLLSWAVGVAMGRFDVHLASGERDMPPEPDPFDPLPAVSPAMVAAPEGDGILLDDEGHDRDIATGVMQVFDYVFGPQGDSLLDEAVHMVGAADLRTWLRREFFAWHVKRYSKSRRKAPIFWQLAVPSGRFSVWLWVHRATADTLHRINALVEDKIRLEASRLDQLRAEAGDTPGPGQRKLLDEQETFIDELRSFHDEIARVAPLWNPNLDDGVIINFALIWRLAPQAKAWQKEAKACWDKLQAGTYDWSHLAMRLWPARVVEKCRSDRSLAIAHGLEEVLWARDEDDKWQPRPQPLVSLDALIAARGSAAVQDALAALQAAPLQDAARRAPRGMGRAPNLPTHGVSSPGYCPHRGGMRPRKGLCRRQSRDLKFWVTPNKPPPFGNCGRNYGPNKASWTKPSWPFGRRGTNLRRRAIRCRPCKHNAPGRKYALTGANSLRRKEHSIAHGANWSLRANNGKPPMSCGRWRRCGAVEAISRRRCLISGGQKSLSRIPATGGRWHRPDD